MLMFIPAIVISGLITFDFSTEIYSNEILLRIEPVYPVIPIDDHIILRYEISSIDLNDIPHDSDFDFGEKIFANLSKKEKFWTIDSLSHSKPVIDEDQVCIKGKVESFQDEPLVVSWEKDTYWKQLFFIRLADPYPQAQNFSAIVSVDYTCSAVLEQLLIEDEPVEFEYL